MPEHQVVSHEAWVKARTAFLSREKELTRLRDAVSRERRELPWEKLSEEYVFEGPDGKRTLADLFDGRSQLIVYHFMYGPGWEEGCKSCSFLADHFAPAIVHLNHRDVSMVAVSRAPLAEFLPFKQRMGWSFDWYSSHGSDFNFRFQASFTEKELENEKAYYNYETGGFPSTEAPGVSVFYRDDEGGVFHTYSSYSRGLDMFIGAYHYLDIVPKGRDEDGLAFTMEWLRLHDAYEN